MALPIIAVLALAATPTQMGLLGEAVGLRPAMGVAAIGAEFAVLWIIFSPVASVREMPTPVAD